MKALLIISGILIGAFVFVVIICLFVWLIVKPGRAAAERNKDIYRERYISSKKR